MRFTLSGIALFKGLKLKANTITCTAKRQNHNRITIKVKKQSKHMQKLQWLTLLILLIFSLMPDDTNTPESTLYSLILPIIFFLLLLRLAPNLRILNYHGAEHKVVVAYRNRLPLTLENVKPISRVTNVCGTMLIAPIILYVSALSSVIMITDHVLFHIGLSCFTFVLLGHYFLLRGQDKTYFNLYRILPLKFIKKTPYKLSSNRLYKYFDQVGYFIQEHITTREPSDDELKVAILCMQRLEQEIKSPYFE